MAGMQARAKAAESRQEIDRAGVAPGGMNAIAVQSEVFSPAVVTNLSPESDLQSSVRNNISPISDNLLSSNALRGFEPHSDDKSASAILQKSVRVSTLVRWLKFNFVGGIGIGVQFFALFLLKTVFRFDYLAATALAVETAVVHNFVWHEQFTWVDRTRPDRTRPDGSRCNRVQPSCLLSPSFTRLLRFNLTNGGVSIVGNLALMKLMVGMGHMNYLLANGIAIALCSLANFLVSDEWVFAERTE